MHNITKTYLVVLKVRLIFIEIMFIGTYIDFDYIYLGLLTLQ